MYEEIFQKFSLSMNREFILSLTPCVLTVIIIWNICKVSVIGMSRIFSLESRTLSVTTIKTILLNHTITDCLIMMRKY